MALPDLGTLAGLVDVVWAVSLLVAVLCIGFVVATTTVVDDGAVVFVWWLGEPWAVVGPGVYLFPPVVTRTASVDTESMELEDGTSLPAALHPTVERVAAGETSRVQLQGRVARGE